MPIHAPKISVFRRKIGENLPIRRKLPIGKLTDTKTSELGCIERQASVLVVCYACVQKTKKKERKTAREVTTSPIPHPTPFSGGSQFLHAGSGVINRVKF